MRNRGTVPRTQKKKKMSAISLPKNQSQDGSQSSNASGAVHPPKNKVIAMPLTANMPRYSARKKSANLKPEYSMKYPAMISDSPSGRSNGERFDSAMAAIRNRTNPAKPHGVKTCQCGNWPE